MSKINPTHFEAQTQKPWRKPNNDYTMVVITFCIGNILVHDTLWDGVAQQNAYNYN